MSLLRSVWLRQGGQAEGYPWDLPAVRAIHRIPWSAQALVLVGDNGTGKSTLVEAIAVASGLNAEGGGRGHLLETRASHSPLHEALELSWGVRGRGQGFFLRAETFYGLVSYAEEAGSTAALGRAHGRSHGEGFLEVLHERLRGPAYFVLDEPESALSFSGSLKLLRILHEALDDGAQVLLATHSPLLMALPGATIVQLDEDGPTEVAWEDVEAVRLWRSFLGSPERFLRHLLG